MRSAGSHAHTDSATARATRAKAPGVARRAATTAQAASTSASAVAASRSAGSVHVGGGRVERRQHDVALEPGAVRRRGEARAASALGPSSAARTIQARQAGSLARRVLTFFWCGPYRRPFDRLLKPLHRRVWADAHRRARKLLRFAETEAAGGRDLSRAAERTRDPLLRRLFLRHAVEEQRHADLFRERGRELLEAAPRQRALRGQLAGAGRARPRATCSVDDESDESLLAFLHLSEKAAAGRFALYGEVLDGDPDTRTVFARILEDEVFHMNYTRTQLARLAPRKQGAAAVAGARGTALEGVPAPGESRWPRCSGR